jgi:hypothetical protein
MEKAYSTLAKVPVAVRCDRITGPFEYWRYAVGHGGINKYPLPVHVSKSWASLKPRLLRTFIQEYFQIYPEHNTYNWKDLDPYMDSLAATGAKAVAAITIKPKPLYPVIDQNIIMPNNIAEWQRVIEALVNRYSVEKQIVTHWEIGNEMDMGEPGGCPYFAKTPQEYIEYYAITQEAVLRAFPEAKVGGPALAVPGNPIMENFIKHCAQTKLPLDFVTWHGYSDDPAYFTGCVKSVRAHLDKYFPGKHIETMVTEFNKWFHEARVEDAEKDGLRSATVMASAMAMADAGVDWSFYYHIWDQLLVAGQFAPFFSDPDCMITYWNKTPCNFGMFDVCGKARLPYFTYRLLARMEGDECETESAAGYIRAKCAVDGSGGVKVMLVNYDPRCSQDIVAEIDFSGLSDGFKLFTIYRIDGKSRFEGGELMPVEQRYTQIASKYSPKPFFCHVALPADSVSFVILEPVAEEDMFK